MKIRHAILAGLSVVALSACGHTTEDRALSGGGIGAGAAQGGIQVIHPVSRASSSAAR